MSWTDRMARASFRGFEFLTDSHDAKSGRRLVVHEFPGAEYPLVEDLGRKAENWRLNAYFVGPDYDLACNGFLAQLDKPGADWLTHPWLGLLWVRAHTWSRQDSNDKGGYCAVSVEFVHGGQTLQPIQDKVDTAFGQIAMLGDAAVADFGLELMSAGGVTAFLAAVHQRLEGLRQVIALAALPLTWANQVKGLIAGVRGDLGALMGMPAAYASALRGVTGALGGGADDSGLPDTARPRVVSRIASVATATAKSVIALPGIAATDGAVRRNLQRESALRSRLLVTAAAQVAMADYRAEADRDAALASVVAALDGLLPNLPDTVFQAAVAARTSVMEALLAQELKPVSLRDITSPMPAIVLAHRLGVDEAVLLARNAVPHPLFVKGRVYG